MLSLAVTLFPELFLCTVACILLLMGISNSPGVRRSTAMLAVIALLIAGITQMPSVAGHSPLRDPRWNTVYVFEFARYIKMLASAIGILLIMLAWPSDPRGTGNPALDFGSAAGEFYGLMLLSIAGIFLVASANDIMLLFLGIELASIPTYIMVSISRPLPVAQEAGVKYFFLGAMAAAVMLFGFSYLYGAFGTVKLDEIAKNMAGRPALTPWQVFAVVMLIGGFAFKMAAVPMHIYAGDVYEGAATPVTAFLSFVPKITGFIALLKILYAISGAGQNWYVASPQIFSLIQCLAILTMTVGNILGLIQPSNIKRVLAYSSVAHTGYMLAGVAALIHTQSAPVQESALQGILFYLTAYGLMNIGAFGVLILLPSRRQLPTTSAETFDDIAGMGRQHVLLGLAMAVSCFSLIGLPLTVGFFGKLYLIAPAYRAGLNWLVIFLVGNAAISAAYYLRIVAYMFLRSEGDTSRFAPAPLSQAQPIRHPIPVLISVGISMVGIIWLGIVLPATSRLTTQVQTASQLTD